MSKEFTTEERSIKILFNDETHRIELNAVSGKEIIMAIESLKNKVAESSGMPYEMALIMAAREEAKEEEQA